MEIKDIATIPNVVTVGRFIGFVALMPRLWNDPLNNWGKAAVIGIGDKVDGTLAKLGDWFPKLQKFGFRRSELGRKLDPPADVAFGVGLIAAGMKNNIIPKSLGMLSIAQKGRKSYHTLRAQAEGINLHVSNLGRYAEAAGTTGMGLFYVAESQEDPVRRQAVRGAAWISSIGGLVGAELAARSYRQAADEERARRLETSVDFIEAQVAIEPATEA